MLKRRRIDIHAAGYNVWGANLTLLIRRAKIPLGQLEDMQRPSANSDLTGNRRKVILDTLKRRRIDIHAAGYNVWGANLTLLIRRAKIHLGQLEDMQYPSADLNLAGDRRKVILDTLKRRRVDIHAAGHNVWGANLTLLIWKIKIATSFC